VTPERHVHAAQAEPGGCERRGGGEVPFCHELKERKLVGTALLRIAEGGVGVAEVEEQVVRRRSRLASPWTGFDLVDAEESGPDDGAASGAVVDAYRTPHSDKLHVVERWRMVDNGNTLEVLVTVDDSDTYYQPWQGLRRYRRAQAQLGEQICAEGNFLLFDYGVPVAKTPDF